MFLVDENCNANSSLPEEQQKVYKECGSACPLTCANLNSDKISCISECVDGCHCPDGLWYDEEGCVPKSQCSCYHGSIYYSHGAKRKSPCEEW